MRKTSLALITALLATACTAAPEGQIPTQQHVAAAAPDGASAAAPAGAGSFESVKYVGTGCPDQSATVAFSPDRQVATITFSAFVAEAGPASDAEDVSKNCLLIAEVNVPQGWQYALESVHHRGFAGLEEQVTATRQSVYAVSGSPVQATAPAQLGSDDDDFIHEDIGAQTPGVWSSCEGGQMLWVATQAEVNNKARPDREGQLAIDSIDVELQWKTCP
jgi:hypothetical protein